MFLNSHLFKHRFWVVLGLEKAFNCDMKKRVHFYLEGTVFPAVFLPLFSNIFPCLMTLYLFQIKTLRNERMLWELGLDWGGGLKLVFQELVNTSLLNNWLIWFEILFSKVLFWDDLYIYNMIFFFILFDCTDVMIRVKQILSFLNLRRKTFFKVSFLKTTR